MGLETLTIPIIICDGEGCGMWSMPGTEPLNHFHTHVRGMESEAKFLGWKQRGMEWFCPECWEKIDELYSEEMEDGN